MARSSLVSFSPSGLQGCIFVHERAIWRLSMFPKGISSTPFGLARLSDYDVAEMRAAADVMKPNTINLSGKAYWCTWQGNTGMTNLPSFVGSA